MLIVSDACQAGLGVYSKATSETPIVEIAKYKGAHMMTAGLMKQKAIGIQEGSLFTIHFIKGLDGMADYNDDDFVTLSELLVYVQNTVSKVAKTEYQQKQTPMLGKISGAGEMIFQIK